jgi:preprotein translocase subunit SecY
LLFTVAAVVVYRLGLHVPVPGVDANRLLDSFSFPASTLFHAYGRALSTATIFSLGITPYLTGSVLVLMLSGLISPLRRLRDGPPEANARFDRLIYASMVVIALVQSLGTATVFETLRTPDGLPVLADPAWVSKALIVLSMTTGAIILAWLADQISRKGIANGVAIILLVDLVAGGIDGISAELAALEHGLQLRGEAIALVAITAALATASAFMITAKRHVPLRYTDQGSAGGSSTDHHSPSIVLRTNTVGVVPVYIAGVVMSAFSYTGLVTPGSIGNWAIYSVLLVPLTYFLTAITFSSTDVVSRLRRYGFRLRDVDSEEAAADHIDQIVERAILPYALFLAAMALVPALLWAWLGTNEQLAYFMGPPLLVISAVGVTIRQSLKATPQEPDDALSRVENETKSWVPVFQAETELEVDLITYALGRYGIPSKRYSNRVICATGTLAFWETSRPTFPSLTIHRRLASGLVEARVPLENIDEARHVLASLGIVAE